MTSLKITPIAANLPFGVRVAGIDREALADQRVRDELKDLFEAQALIVFEDVEQSAAMQVAISDVFGPMKDHPSEAVPRVDGDAMPGVIDMQQKPNEPGVVRIGEREVAHWLPWHFDHCYNDELNRAGVLRAIEIAPEGGLTGFVDGIQLYEDLSPPLRDRIEGKSIVYRMNVILGDMRFGLPEGFAELSFKPWAVKVMDAAKGTPRAIHPAVWTRASGEKVLHVSPWMADGIAGEENEVGDALFEAVCQDISAKARAYYHTWKPSDMLIWDNWRLLHCVTGIPPQYGRRMQRTTIKGDYGLGRFENGGTGDKILEMTV